jgi:flavin-binding protein dodecin
MSVAKHIEITAESTKSIEAAIQDGISKASETIKGIRSAWVKDQTVLVEKGKVTGYRVNMKLTFVLD